MPRYDQTDLTLNDTIMTIGNLVKKKPQRIQTRESTRESLYSRIEKLTAIPFSELKFTREGAANALIVLVSNGFLIERSVRDSIARLSSPCKLLLIEDPFAPAVNGA